MNGITSQLIRAALLVMTLVVAAAPAVAQEVVEYIHTDALGSPVAITDANGTVIERTVYEPYGAVVNRPLTDGPGYTGHVTDSGTGLSYMQQRYYDSELGVFLSVDPIAVGAEVGALFNRYMYAANNPIVYIDPDGRCTGSKIKNRDGSCASTGGATTRSVPVAVRESVVPSASDPLPVSESSTWSEVKSRLGLSGDLTKNGNILDFGALFHDIAIPAMNSPGGGVLASGAVLAGAARVQFNIGRAGHIFRDAVGHVNPVTAASRLRYVRMFENVASNPANYRADAASVGLITQDAAAAGVSAYTVTARNGYQIWVTVRKGEVMNAGVNAAGSAR